MDGRRLASCVYTFYQPPSALFKGDAGELCSPAQKKQVLQSMGVEELVQADFSAVRELSPEQFVEEVLHGLLDARLVSCGFNYRFGRGGSGDAALLAKLCARWGIQVVTVPAVEIDGRPVSSSRIRRLVEQGDMPQAARLLGRPFRVDFPVVTGQRLGRVLGTPTINQPLPEGFVHPRFGVYASSVETGEKFTTASPTWGCVPPWPTGRGARWSSRWWKRGFPTFPGICMAGKCRCRWSNSCVRSKSLIPGGAESPDFSGWGGGAGGRTGPRTRSGNPSGAV